MDADDSTQRRDFTIAAVVLAVSVLLARISGASVGTMVIPMGLAVFILPGPVAIAVAAERWRMAWVLVGLVACGAGFVSFFTPINGQPSLPPAMILWFAVVAAAGLPIGIGCRRGWPYGWCVTAGTAVTFVVASVAAGVTWDAWHAAAEAFIAGLAAEAGTYDPGSWMALSLERSQTVTRACMAAPFGIVFFVTLLAETMVVAYVTRWLRVVRGVPGPVGSFRRMRTNEWLVWVAIATAVLFLLDYRWPQPMLKPWMWNLGVALTAVYWLNGLAILVFVMTTWRHNRWVVWLGIALLITSKELLVIPGFFDTWANYRRKIEMVVALREQQRRDDDNST